ncbi:MAG: AraC family transcriptional regulator [Hungatella sp.]
MNQLLFRERTEGFMIDRVLRDSEFTMPIRHLHSEYEIYYLLEGAQNYFIEHETYFVCAGTVVLIDRDKIHKTSTAGAAHQDRMVMELHQEWINPFLHAIGFWTIEQFFSEYRIVQLDEAGQIYVKTLFLAIGEEMRTKKLGYECIVKMKLAEFMFYILRFQNRKDSNRTGCVVQSPKYSKVHEVADYIQSHYRDPLSLQSLAEEFYVSKCYLSRIFKAVTGLTVHEYIAIQRVKQGKYLLEQETYNITQISELVGFDSITYFEKVFKKYTGHTPGKYRKSKGSTGGSSPF